MFENFNDFIARDESICGIYGGKKAKFISILLFSCFSASDVTIYVAKQKHYDVGIECLP